MQGGRGLSFQQGTSDEEVLGREFHVRKQPRIGSTLALGKVTRIGCPHRPTRREDPTEKKVLCPLERTIWHATNMRGSPRVLPGLYANRLDPLATALPTSSSATPTTVCFR